MNNQEHQIITTMGEMADDIVFSILMIKVKDYLNNFLPFMHAHALELSAKAACLQLNLDYKTIRRKHDLISIFRLIATILPAINNHIPTEQDLKDYKRFWVPFDDLQKDVNANPSSPDELYKWELAYFVDNITDLKYGVNTKLIQVSPLIPGIGYPHLNPYFMGLYCICRNVYSIPSIDERLKNKIFSTFGKIAVSESLVNNLLSSNPKVAIYY